MRRQEKDKALLFRCSRNPPTHWMHVISRSQENVAASAASRANVGSSRRGPSYLRKYIFLGCKQHEAELLSPSETTAPFISRSRTSARNGRKGISFAFTHSREQEAPEAAQLETLLPSNRQSGRCSTQAESTPVAREHHKSVPPARLFSTYHPHNSHYSRVDEPDAFCRVRLGIAVIADQSLKVSCAKGKFWTDILKSRTPY